MGLLFVYSVDTLAAVYRQRISADPVFLAQAAPTSGGTYVITRRGSILKVDVSREAIVRPPALSDNRERGPRCPLYLRCVYLFPLRVSDRSEEIGKVVHGGHEILHSILLHDIFRLPLSLDKHFTAAVLLHRIPCTTAWSSRALYMNNAHLPGRENCVTGCFDLSFFPEHLQ